MKRSLYNGICLPNEWPPGNMDPTSDAPMPVPYLINPPEIVPIDVGRQLFVDNFLVAESTLVRRFTKPKSIRAIQFSKLSKKAVND